MHIIAWSNTNVLDTWHAFESGILSGPLLLTQLAITLWMHIYNLVIQSMGFLKTGLRQRSGMNERICLHYLFDETQTKEDSLPVFSVRLSFESPKVDRMIYFLKLTSSSVSGEVLYNYCQ